jgi:Aldo/keto reductase family
LGNVEHVGTSDLDAAPLCLGGNPFGWTADEATSFAVLDAYAEAGGNFIDTADRYTFHVPGNNGGESETIIGRWLKTRGNRDRMVAGYGMRMLRVTSAAPPKRTRNPDASSCAVAVIVEGLPRESPMSTARSLMPWPARCAARQAVLLALAMSSATPIDGANMRAATRPVGVGTE